MSEASQNKKSQKSEKNSTTLNPENLNQEMGKKNKRRNNARSSADTENAKEQENNSPTDSMMHMSQMTEKTEMYDHDNDLQASSI